MLIPMKEIKTKTYPLDKGFFIDIVTKCKTYEAWLYHNEIGIKHFMFGIPKNKQPYEAFLSVVESNLDEYIDYYTYEYLIQTTK